jgi:hypothetical protein
MKKLLSKLFKRTVFPDLRVEHKVKEAFIFEGVQYYEFDDVFQMPCDRAFSAMDYYEELRQRTTREYLQAHVEATEELLTAKKIDIYRIREINQFLKERVEFITDPDIIYKLASVIYFDKSENPYKYDMKYGQEKIKKWKEADIGDFFLQTPIRELLPWENISEGDLKNYASIITEIKKRQLSKVSSPISSDKKNSEWYNTLQSQDG